MKISVARIRLVECLFALALSFKTASASATDVHELQKSCQWTKATKIRSRSCAHHSELDMENCVKHEGDAPDEFYGLHELSPKEWPLTNVEVCHQPLLRAMRLGPFVSTPQLAWRCIRTSPFYEQVLSNGDRIVANVNLPVLEDGTPIGYPPIHNHHVHIRKGDRTMKEWTRGFNNHWFETHGDHAVGADFGIGANSTKGYITENVDGYCTVVDEAHDIDLEAVINDVRFNTTEPIKWYLVVAFQLSDDSLCKPVSKYWFRHPQTTLQVYDWWGRYQVPSGPSVTWWSGTMPQSGRMLKAWLHSHRAFFKEVLLLASSPEDLAFSCSNYRIDQAKSNGDYAVSADQNFTRAAFLRHGKVICQSEDPDTPTAVEVTGQTDIADGMYDRRGSLQCSEWNFSKGTPWTIVAFGDARWPVRGSSFMQHTELWMYVDNGLSQSFPTPSLCLITEESRNTKDCQDIRQTLSEDEMEWLQTELSPFFAEYANQCYEQNLNSALLPQAKSILKLTNASGHDQPRVVQQKLNSALLPQAKSILKLTNASGQPRVVSWESGLDELSAPGLYWTVLSMACALLFMCLVAVVFVRRMTTSEEVEVDAACVRVEMKDCGGASEGACEGTAPIK